MNATTGLLLVEPVAFGFNAETAATNRFQNFTDLPPTTAAALARAEFAGLVGALRGAGIPVAVAADNRHAGEA